MSLNKFQIITTSLIVIVVQLLPTIASAMPVLARTLNGG